MPSLSVFFIITEHATHVDLLLDGLGLGLLLLFDGGGGGGSGGHVGEEGLDVLSFEGLGEKAGPESFNGVVGSLDNLGEFISL